MDGPDPEGFAAAVPDTVKYYLGRTRRLLDRVAREPDPGRLLAVRLAPDMFDTAFQFALAIRFAGRALMAPAGRTVPEAPEAPSLADLLAFHETIEEAVDPLFVRDMGATVTHRAGEADFDGFHVYRPLRRG